MFPDVLPRHLGNVLWLTAEDGLADTIRPRIDRGAAGLCFGGGAGLGAAWHSTALDGTAPYDPKWSSARNCCAFADNANSTGVIQTSFPLCIDELPG